jgi:hypothetical protein
MSKLVLLVLASVSLIVIPAAVAHGKSTGHTRTHASTSHSANPGHRGRKASHRFAMQGEAGQSQSAQRTDRHPDEEELAVDESASKAKAN